MNYVAMEIPPSPEQSMYKFVTSDVATITQKRKQQARACESCRRKKRRCEHNPAPNSSQSDLRPRNSNAQTSPDNQEAPMIVSAQDCNDHHEQEAEQVRQGHQVQQPNQSICPTESSTASTYVQDANTISIGLGQVDGSRPHDEHRDETLGSRFIGDLSPEGILLAATSPDSMRGTSLNDHVGIWLANSLNNRGQAPGSIASNPTSQTSLFHGLHSSASLIQKVLMPVLEEEILSTLPPQENFLALSQIYFERCHPVFPIIDKVGLHGLQPTDPNCILLQQGICLAASRNFVAKEHLLLRGSQSPISYKEFGDRIFASMRLSVETGLVTDKIVLIQALSLMCQFANGPDSGDLSSQLCGRAIHHGQSIGLHLKGQHGNEGDIYGTTLLCCVWALDRMNAAFNGKPVLMHERDFGVDILECFEQQEPCFRLLLQVTILLDKVIELYRPSSNLIYSGLEVEFPAFEEIVAECSASHIVTPLLGTLIPNPLYISICRS